MERERSSTEDRETEAAAREAGEIGGRVEPETDDPAQRPLAEAGEGEAEGFEAAERMLRDRAEHREPGGNPRYDRPAPEPDDPRAEYGEPDEEHSAEASDSDR